MFNVVQDSLQMGIYIEIIMGLKCRIQTQGTKGNIFEMKSIFHDEHIHPI